MVGYTTIYDCCEIYYAFLLYYHQFHKTIYITVATEVSAVPFQLSRDLETTGQSTVACRSIAVLWLNIVLYISFFNKCCTSIKSEYTIRCHGSLARTCFYIILQLPLMLTSLRIKYSLLIISASLGQKTRARYCLKSGIYYIYRFNMFFSF